MPLTLTPLLNVPLIGPGDDLTGIIVQALLETQIELEDNDVLVVTQKVVSKSEGCIRELSQIQPSPEAVHLASSTGKDARLVELVLQESSEILCSNSHTIISEHRIGFVCPNAGIDQANVAEDNVDKDTFALLLPKNPDQSAQDFQKKIELRTGKRIGVLIIDSHGRPWRKGSVGICIGISGVPATVSFRGQKDLFGRVRRNARVAVADELAAAASLVMGQNAEGYPVVHVRGFPYQLRESSLKEILRVKEKDLFR